MNDVSALINFIDADLDRFCRTYSKIYLYGAGTVAQIYVDILHKKNITLCGILVTKKLEKETFINLPVYQVDTVVLDEKCGIIAAFIGSNELMLREYIGSDVGIFSMSDDEFRVFSSSIYVIPFLSKIKQKYYSNSLTDKERWKKILVVRLDVLGDLIMTTPFLRELRKNCPNAHITLVVLKQYYSLFCNCPYISELVLYDSPIISAELAYQIQQVNDISKEVRKFLYETNFHKQRYDVTFLPASVFQGVNSVATFLLAIAVESKCLVGRTNSFSMNERFLYLRLKDIFTLLSYDTKVKHEAQHMLDLLVYCSCKITDRRMEIWPNEEDKKFANYIIKRKKSSIIFVAIGLVGRHPAKNWSIKHYIEFITQCCVAYKKEIEFVLLGGKDAIEGASYIKEKCSGEWVLDLTGKTTLSQASAVMELCDIYVGADTGLMHMAVGLNKPVIELSPILPDCPTSEGLHPMRMGPWMVKSKVLRPQKALGHCTHVCRYPYSHCINIITPDDVLKALNDMLFQEKNYGDVDEEYE